ncbi:DUF4381 domain-containing protein [Marinomonas sp. 5E14-1]|uniref:DUF4381 domain-containing protein n=1 Tax=Marinomonas sp. 5E14-1 TaxID=3153922 RepID=UPI00326383F7
MPDSQTQATMSLPNEAYLLPESIAMWPPAWWAWLIFALLILLICAFVFYRYRRYKERTYRREALNAVIKASSDLPDKECILLCHEMIRRCLISENKIEMAALPSSALLEKIDLTMPKKYQFSLLGNTFFDGPYRSKVELTPEQRSAMIKTTRYWIGKHHA